MRKYKSLKESMSIMKKLVSIVLAFGLALSFSNCASTKKPKNVGITTERIAREVEEIIRTTDENVNLGVKIASLSDGKTIFEKNAGRHFVPASTMKLVTLAAALHYLGPSYRFNTTIWTDGFTKVEGKTADTSVNNIFIQGSGDPSFTDHDLMELVSELKQIGIRQITGNIYVDDGIFDEVLWVRGAMWDDRNRGFSAPISGLNFNYNRLLIKTVPANRVGKKAHSIIKPATSYVDVVTDALTKGESSTRQITYAIVHGKGREEKWPRASNDGLHQGDKVVMQGFVGKSAPPAYSLLAVNDPAMLAGTYFKDLLESFGVKVNGAVLRKATPANSVKLATYESRSLAEALIDFTKVSNNIANDTLVKSIAAQAGTKPANFSAGLKLIGDFLTNQVGIDANSLIAADGAGASRYNLITPEQMVKLLIYAANHFRMGPEFMSALPIGGEDGTLGGRMSGTNQRGHVRAKTGSSTGISSLAGYLTGEDGNRYVFTIMVNGFIGNSSKYLRMQEQILATMMRNNTAPSQLANSK